MKPWLARAWWALLILGLIATVWASASTWNEGYSNRVALWSQHDADEPWAFNLYYASDRSLRLDFVTESLNPQWAPYLMLTTVRTTVSVPTKGTLLMGGSRLVNAPPPPPPPWWEGHRFHFHHGPDAWLGGHSYTSITVPYWFILGLLLTLAAFTAWRRRIRRAHT